MCRSEPRGPSPGNLSCSCSDSCRGVEKMAVRRYTKFLIVYSCGYYRRWGSSPWADQPRPSLLTCLLFAGGSLFSEVVEVSH